VRNGGIPFQITRWRHLVEYRPFVLLHTEKIFRFMIQRIRIAVRQIHRAGPGKQGPAVSVNSGELRAVSQRANVSKMSLWLKTV
jgi:hypothetical protein